LNAFGKASKHSVLKIKLENLGCQGWCKNNIFECLLSEMPFGSLKAAGFASKIGESRLYAVRRGAKIIYVNIFYSKCLS
jgi:hypothetical protein